MCLYFYYEEQEREHAEKTEGIVAGSLDQPRVRAVLPQIIPAIALLMQMFAMPGPALKIVRQIATLRPLITALEDPHRKRPKALKRELLRIHPYASARSGKYETQFGNMRA
jgi:hypothetical protein